MNGNPDSFENNSQKKITFINGATSSVGTALLQKLAPSRKLVLFSRRNLPVESLPVSESPDVRWIIVDPCDAAAMEKTLDNALEETGGRCDEYVHLIGNLLLKPLHLTTLEEWRATLDINLNSIFYALKRLLPVMKTQNSGSIVLVSSVAAKVGLANHEAIAAAKGAVASLTRSLASTYAPYGIRANAIAPGLVQSQMTQKLLSNEMSLKASLAMSPLKRVGQPSEIAAAIEFLLSEASAWTTGQVWSVDGGMADVKPIPRV